MALEKAPYLVRLKFFLTGKSSFRPLRAAFPPVYCYWQHPVRPECLSLRRPARVCRWPRSAGEVGRYR